MDENGKSEVKADLEKKQTELQQKKDALQETLNDSLIQKDGNSVKREQKARDTIDFVDDMGIYALGTTENIDVFFRTIAKKAGTVGLTIDPNKGFDKKEKIFIRNEFSRLIGSNIFKSGFDFTRQEDMQDIGSIREKLTSAHGGVFRKEPPYITANGIELLVQ